MERAPSIGGGAQIWRNEEGALPALVLRAGPEVAERFLEFFALTIRNANTREAYVRAVRAFLDWCEGRRLELAAIRPMHVAAYIELLSKEHAARTVKQHLAAIRGVFGWLVTGGKIASNPAADVRGPTAQATTGKAPVLFEETTRGTCSRRSTCPTSWACGTARSSAPCFTLSRACPPSCPCACATTK